MCIEFQHLSCQVVVIKGLAYFIAAKMTRHWKTGLSLAFAGRNYFRILGLGLDTSGLVNIRGHMSVPTNDLGGVKQTHNSRHINCIGWQVRQQHTITQDASAVYSTHHRLNEAVNKHTKTSTQVRVLCSDGQWTKFCWLN